LQREWKENKYIKKKTKNTNYEQCPFNMIPSPQFLCNECISKKWVNECQNKKMFKRIKKEENFDEYIT